MGFLSKICIGRFRKKKKKRAARIILNQDINTRSHVLFSELRRMPLADRIDYHRSIQVYKFLNNNNNQGLNELFQYNKISITIVLDHLNQTIYTHIYVTKKFHLYRCKFLEQNSKQH